MIRQRIEKKINDCYSIYRDIANKFSNKIDTPDDILNETLLDILLLSDDKLIKIEPYLDKYIVSILKLSFISKTSKYQQKYNKLSLNNDKVNDYDFRYIMIDEYDDTIDKRLSLIEEILRNKCTWYEAEVFREYLYSNLSFLKLSEKYDIPCTSLWNTYQKALIKIKNNIKNG